MVVGNAMHACMHALGWHTSAWEHGTAADFIGQICIMERPVSCIRAVSIVSMHDLSNSKAHHIAVQSQLMFSAVSVHSKCQSQVSKSYFRQP